MHETIISYEPPTHDGTVVRWDGHLDDRNGDRSTLHQSFTCPDPDAFEPTGRPLLLSFLLPAMRLGDPVRVDGPVDAVTVASLMEWQEAMVRWHPSTLSVVPIAADDAGTTEPSALATGIGAFSGGVDSCFTALRHQPARAAETTSGYRRTTMAAGLMVQGFDIGLDQPEVFASAFARSSTMLEALGIDAYRIHTDVRALEARFPVDWETASHGIWLAGALACLEQWFHVALIPSTFAYDHQKLPWASNPLTDPLLGSASTPLWHDGAAFDKLDKVHAISAHPAIAAGLRVCWEGERLDRNCGHCYKCIVTQACWWLSGVDAPACFADPAEPAELAPLEFERPYRRLLAEKMAAWATAQGRDQVADALARSLAR